MDHDRLARSLGDIESARTVGELVERLRAHLRSLGGAAWARLQLRRVEDIGSAAVEVARVRMASPGNDPTLEAVESLLARGAVRAAELLDRSGAWHVFQARTRATRPGAPD